VGCERIAAINASYSFDDIPRYWYTPSTKNPIEIFSYIEIFILQCVDCELAILVIVFCGIRRSMPGKLSDSVNFIEI
jgi:hypothetical protein